MKGRWEADQKSHGIADGRWMADDIGELLAAVKAEDWVAENPELHLLPHLEAACRREDSPFALETTGVAPEGTFMAILRWRHDADAGIGHVRAAIFNLLGEFAESVTYVRQRQPWEVTRQEPMVHLRRTVTWSFFESLG